MSFKGMAGFRPQLIGATAIAAALVGPAIAESAAPMLEIAVENFDGDALPDGIAGGNAELSLVESGDGKALKAVLKTRDNNYASIAFTPAQPLDLSAYAVAGISFDLHNPGPESIQFNIDFRDARGHGQTRSTVVPAGGGGRYFAEIKGPDTASDSGLRDNPQDWLIDGQDLTWMWGTRELDASAISEIRIVAQSLPSDRVIVLDNIRIVANPPRDADYLSAIMDPFGQLSGYEYPERVTSELDLQEHAVAELDTLTGQPMAGRSRWQGWKDGPKLEATGFFRTAKVGDRWSLVDPDGYLFFSTGIDNIRMANTSTMTGYAFRPGFVDARDPNDTTPEDSTGLNRVGDAALPGRYVASELRRNLFSWLPEYDGELGDHYGYRREVHTGPVKAGETFSFYRANLERKYGADYMESWRQVTKARMLDWGFTSYGNWLDPSYYADPAVPYFANGWIIGDFKTVSSGDDLWAPLPDPFDPVFEQRARATAAQIAREVQGSPWCIGVFIDNEKSWGRMGSIEGQYGIVIDTMSRSAEDSPTKAHWMGMLREKYGSVEALNAAWSSNYRSWREIANGVEIKEHNDAKIADYSAMLEAYANQYFRIVDMTLNEVLPNHLYMGARFADWGKTPEVVRAAARYADVVSYNIYSAIPHEDKWGIIREFDKPAIIGEFHIGAQDGALSHPGLVMAADAEDRARMYTTYMDTVIAHPNLVGAHWFQYIDSPLTGRAHDGENYNIGFVTIADIPYQPIVDAARDMNRTVYQDRFGDPATLTVGD